MELSKSKIKKVNNFGIVGKVFKCRIYLFGIFVIRGHKRSTEVIKGQGMIHCHDDGNGLWYKNWNGL